MFVYCEALGLNRRKVVRTTFTPPRHLSLDSCVCNECVILKYSMQNWTGEAHIRLAWEKNDMELNGEKITILNRANILKWWRAKTVNGYAKCWKDIRRIAKENRKHRMDEVEDVWCTMNDICSKTTPNGRWMYDVKDVSLQWMIFARKHIIRIEKADVYFQKHYNHL